MSEIVSYTHGSVSDRVKVTRSRRNCCDVWCAMEVPDQPLYFSETERPSTSLADTTRQFNSRRSRFAGGTTDAALKIISSARTVTSHGENASNSKLKLKRRYNLRRLNELPFHLVRCRRTDQLLDEVRTLEVCSVYLFVWLMAE